MAETLTIRTATSTDVIKVVERGPQGPAGVPGSGLETLTTQGDLLYRGATVGERLPIGTSGQVLKVSNGLPAWANESGAVASVNDQTGYVYLDGSEINTSASDDRMAFIASGFDDDSATGLYYPLDDLTINSKRIYKSTNGYHAFFENSRWHLTDGTPITENIVASSNNNNAAWPWKTTWPGTVTEATVADVVGRARSTFLFQGDLFPKTMISGLGTAAEEDVGAFATASHSHELDALDATGGGAGDLLVADGAGGVSWESFISPSVITGTAVVDNDARLSNSRTPTAHAASHAAGTGSDPLAPSDIGAQSIFVTEQLTLTTTAQVTLSPARAKVLTIVQYAGGNVDVVLPQSGNQNGDVFVFKWGTGSDSVIVREFAGGSPRATISAGQQKRVQRTASGWEEVPVDTHTHAAADITSGTLTHERGGLEADVSAYNGLVKISGGATSAVGIGTGSTEVAAGDHVHGNLTSDGKIGSTAGLPVVTTTAGAVTTLALGAAGTVLTVNSGANGVEFAAASTSAFDPASPAAIGTTTPNTGAFTSLSTAPAANTAALTTTGYSLTGSNAQSLVDLAGTWNTTGTPSAIKLNITNTASNASSLLMQLQTGGTNRLTVSAGGNLNASGEIRGTSLAIGSSPNASGFNAAVIGGRSNSATNDRSIAGGDGCAASGTNSLALGNASGASGSASVALGQTTVASGDQGMSIGLSSRADRRAIFAHAAGTFAANGDAQRIRAVLRCTTSNATATELFLDGASTRLTIPTNKIMAGIINIVGTKTDGAAVAHYVRQFCVKNVSGTSSEVYAAQTIGTDNAAGTSITFNNPDTNGDALSVSVTGIASENWRWVASVDAVEVTRT